MENNQQNPWQILPIVDTISGNAARENPEEALEHYNHLANQIWLSPKVSDVAKGVFSNVQQGRTAWGSLSGPYGFGKTASAIALWEYAKNSGFLAIPPLSCTNFDELASGIAALAGVQSPKIKKQIDKLFRNTFTNGLNPIVQADAKRYDVSSRKVRQIYRDKFSSGQFTLDSHPNQTVEFLSKLGQLAAKYSKGLVIVLDELQQLLGPLDARAIVQFREFVWGIRTERSPCGVLLALDSLLESRLSHWAADILHRIRENGPVLQLTDVYTRAFPEWLWGHLTNGNGKRELTIQPDALSKNVLLSLGQLVERPDLANGPRTVVDVFSRAAAHYEEKGIGYDVSDLIDDVHQGQFRYFGEGATIQKVLTQILSDEWILEDEGRRKLVKTLAVFPQGCSQQTLQDHIPDEKELEQARSELFGPLLVELSEGLALEQLQQVRRTHNNWEQILSRCWETLPALDALVDQTPDMILRILVPRLFPKGTPSVPVWEWISDEASAVLTGWRTLQGTFDDAYPQREVALCMTEKEPESWPEDVDVCIALVCDTSTNSDVTPKAELLEKNGVHHILLRLPILKSLTERIPADLQRYKKYIQPEPFRPVTILAALYHLEPFLGGSIDNSDVSLEEGVEMKRGRAFAEIVVDFTLRELLVGTVDTGMGTSISLRGSELLRALFTQVCHHHFPQYQTLKRTANWRDILSNYREGLKSDMLSLPQRQGREEVLMAKAEMYETLFDQTSTAAADSFIKKLEPFVETKENSEVFSLRLTMHPAEDALISYFKGLSGQKPIPFDAAVEFLRHQGYIEVETEEIVEVLIARECITRDSNGDILFIPNADIERSRLLEKITEVNDELCRLEGTNTAAINQNTAMVDLQKYLNQRQARLKTVVEEQIKDLKNGVNTLRDLRGGVNAVAISMKWLDSDLSIHLTGIATKLKASQESLLKTLGRELKKLTKDLDFSPDTVNVEWAIIRRSKDELFSKTLQKHQRRVKEFEKRSEALTSWENLNNQLRSTDMLCAKVSKAEPAPEQALNQLVTEFKERFATEAWDPLLASGEFSERLTGIQSEVQSLFYSHSRAFSRELAVIRNQFRSLLPSTPPPVFEVSVERSQQMDPIHESFQKLYQWTFDGFRRVIAEYQELKKSGSQWRDPDNKRRSWKKLEVEVKAELQKTEGLLELEAIQRIGPKILLMQRGFAELPFGFYDDPKKPPDFERLEQLFGEGEIQIRVEPKKLKGN